MNRKKTASEEIGQRKRTYSIAKERPNTTSSSQTWLGSSLRQIYLHNFPIQLKRLFAAALGLVRNSGVSTVSVMRILSVSNMKESIVPRLLREPRRIVASKNPFITFIY
jgi:hypothetical protein